MEGRVKGGVRHGDDGIAEKSNGGGFAESAGFALKSDARRFEFGKHSHPCVQFHYCYNAAHAQKGETFGMRR